MILHMCGGGGAVKTLPYDMFLGTGEPSGIFLNIGIRLPNAGHLQLKLEALRHASSFLHRFFETYNSMKLLN